MENLRNITEKTMKNRWQINEKSFKIELGGVLGPLEASWNALLASLIVLGASWERLGASWGRPGVIPGPEGVPTWTPGRAQNPPQINPKSHWFFDRFLDAMLIPKWSQNGSPNHPKTVQKSVPFFDRFFHRFLDRSWGPKSLKMSTSCPREAHFHKIAFSDSDIFLEAKMTKKGSQNGSKMVSKINEEIRVLFYRFWTDQSPARMD